MVIHIEISFKKQVSISCGQKEDVFRTLLMRTATLQLPGSNYYITTL